MILEEDHPDDARPERAAAKVVDALDPVYFARWPAKAALRYARAMGVAARVGASKEAAPALANGAPLGPKEPAAILQHALVAFGHGYPFQLEQLVYALEELAGNAATLPALTQAFEALAASAKKSPKRHRSAYAQQGAALAAGFLLLRAEPKAAKAARARLEKLGDPESSTPPLATLGLVLGGRAALASSGYTWTPPETWLFSDDPAFVTEAIRTAKGEVDFDPRGVWLGGDAVLPLYAKHVKKTPRARAPFVAECIGMFRGEAADALAALVAAKVAPPKAQKK